MKIGGKNIPTPVIVIAAGGALGVGYLILKASNGSSAASVSPGPADTSGDSASANNDLAAQLTALQQQVNGLTATGSPTPSGGGGTTSTPPSTGTTGNLPPTIPSTSPNFRQQLAALIAQLQAQAQSQAGQPTTGSGTTNWSQLVQQLVQGLPTGGPAITSGGSGGPTVQQQTSQAIFATLAATGQQTHDAATTLSILQKAGFSNSDIANSGVFGPPASALTAVGQALPTGASTQVLPQSAYTNYSATVQGPGGMFYDAYQNGNLIAHVPVTPSTDIVALNKQYGVGNQ